MKNKIIYDAEDSDFGSLVICAIRYCMGRRTYMPSTIIGVVTPIIAKLDTNTLRCIDRDLSEPAIYGGLGDEKIDEPLWLNFHSLIKEEIQNRKETIYENICVQKES